MFGHLAVTDFQMCCYVQNFIESGWLFVEIYRFNHLQYGVRAPFKLFEI